MEHKFSIILPTKNRVKYIKNVIDTYLKDDYPNKEIIVKDAVSTDGTIELLKSYGEKIKWLSEPDKGEYEARNKAISIATGDILQFATDDDILLPGSFTKANDFFNTHPEVDILFGNTIQYILVNGEKRVMRGVVENGPNVFNIHKIIRGGHDFFTTAGFVRKRVTDKIGSFSTDYIAGDMEFWVRAAANGVKFAGVPDIFQEYFLTGDNAVIKFDKIIIKERFEMVKKYGNFNDFIAVFGRKKIGEPIMRMLRKVLNKPELSIYKKRVK